MDLRAIHLIFALLLFAAELTPVAADTIQLVGDCTLNLQEANVSPGVTFNVSCARNQAELAYFAASVEKYVKEQRLSTQQTQATISGLNTIIKTEIIPRLNTIARLKDTLDGVIGFLQLDINSSMTPNDIQVIFSANRGKILPGTFISECGCWGKPSFPAGHYGASRANPSCLGGQEQTVACIMKDGPNICGHGGLLGLFETGPGYAPFARICKLPGSKGPFDR